MATLFSACSAMDSMDSMKKNTQDMKKDTREMSDNFSMTQEQIGETNQKMGETNQKMDNMTDSLNETNKKMSDMTTKLDSMSGSMDKMYSDLRQGDAMQARVKSIEMMENTEELGAKVTHAAHYLLSFEYQLWKGDTQDTPEKRLSLMNDAVRELATDIQRYISDDHSVSTGNADARLKNLFAIAMSLHMNNPSNESLLRSKGLEPVSMFALIKSGLASGAALKNGTIKLEELPAHASSVLEYEANFIYLLQLRSNMFPGMVVGSLSNADSDSYMGLKGIWSKINLFLRPWDAKTPDRNLVQLRLYASWLQDAAALRCFLVENNLPTRDDTLLLKVLRNMRIPELESGQTAFSDDSQRRAGLESLSTALSNLLASVQ
jgi:hypothetical protein